MLDQFLNWFLVFGRVGTVLALLPMFSVANFPVRVRVALSALLAFLLVPFLPTGVLQHLSLFGLLRLLTMEIGVGLLFGFVCRLVFFALEAAGNMIATEMGLTMTAEFSQFSNTMNPAPSQMLYWLAVMLWCSLDLHHWMIAALQRSYVLVPVGGAHLSQALLEDVLHRSSTIFVIALQIAAPIIGISFMLSLVFAMLGRAVPQMNVFSESFPVRTLVGLIVFGSTTMFMAQHIANYLKRLPEDVLRVCQLLGPG